MGQVGGQAQGFWLAPAVHSPQHHYVPCRLSSKPLIVLHLVLGMNFSRALCFTNSREHSHR